MMHTRIATDEMYPTFFDGNRGIEVELTEAEATFIANAWDAFNQMQELLERKYTEAGGKDEKGFLRH